MRHASSKLAEGQAPFKVRPALTGVAAAAALLAVAGCAPTELQVGMAPKLRVSTPSWVEDPSGYWGANYCAHWQGVGVDVGLAGRSPDEIVVTLSATPWLGWLWTYLPQESATNSWWFALKPGVGVWSWSDSTEDFGPLVSVKAGFGCHLNDYNTFGVEYGWVQMFNTHDDGIRRGDTQMSGVNFTYSLKF